MGRAERVIRKCAERLNGPSTCRPRPHRGVVAPEPTVLPPTTATAAGLPAVPLLIPFAWAQQAPVAVPRFSMVHVLPERVQTAAHCCLAASSLLPAIWP